MLKKVLSYYKPHRKLFIIDMVSATVVAALELLLPYYSRFFLDDYIPNGNISLLIRTGIFIFGLYFVRAIAMFIMAYWGHVMGTKIERDMRRDLFFHFQEMSSRFYEDTKVGSLMSRLVGDLRDISELAHHGPEDLFLSIIMFIGSFTILYTFNIKLTLIIFVIVILIVVFAVNRRRKMMNAFRRTRKFHAELNGKIENSLSGIRLTKAFTNEKFEKSKFVDVNNQYQQSWRGAYLQMGIFHSMINFLVSLITLVTLTIGGYFVYLGEISYGELVAYLLFVSFFVQPIRRLINMFEQFQRGFSGIERFYNMMQENNEIVDGKEKLKSTNGRISFKNVGFKYNDETDYILKDFNLEIEQGTTVALVGKTGVGKTTITKLVPRFYDVTDGEVLLDDVNIKKFTKKSLRQNIGHVQQESHIFFGTIRENIEYGKPDATMEEIVEAAKLANIHDFIITLEKGYETEVGERGVKLSGGQKQRISLARVFLKNPPILLLDEATSALDNETERNIQSAIERISVNRTTIVVAHRLTTIQNADRILVITDEGIAEDGNHHELMALNGIYKSLYEANRDGFIE